MIKKILTTTIVVATLAIPALAEGDAAKGERVYNKCRACHAVGADAKNKVGPALNGIVGAPAGQVEGFNYSDALLAKAAEGLVWDEETLGAFLKKPRDVIDRTKMSFPGLRKEEEIADVIAYLATFE